jgi:hypothetical protein
VSADLKIQQAHQSYKIRRAVISLVVENRKIGLLAAVRRNVH